ncbi:MAG: hypothetical protein HC868_11135 [Sphingomonadales bacterium]|nr:hypothetical protein [Sphingomonadales bacterium]
MIGALDIGTSKVCCLIAETDAQGGHRLLGFGHQRMRGIKAGVVVDPEKAERAVRAAVAQAERMAGLTLARAVVAGHVRPPEIRDVHGTRDGERPHRQPR